MKKTIRLLFLFFVSIFLFACGQLEVDDSNKPSNDILDNNQENPDTPDVPDIPDVPDTPDIPDEPTETEFVVSIIYKDGNEKKLYIPSKDEVITVVWADDYSKYTAQIDSTGYAKKRLEGDFNVYLDNIPNGYTYNPNIYSASSDEPDVVIELINIIKPIKGTGSALYKEYEISTLGAYRAELKKETSKIYYEFAPKQNGYYYIESIVNIHKDEINPKIDVYNGNTAYKNFYKTLNDGGISSEDGFTKNFRWIVKRSDEELGGGVNAFTFSVYADTSVLSYPLTVDFIISYQGEYLTDPTISKFMEAKEANFITPDYDLEKYTFLNTNGGKGNYYTGQFNGSSVISGSMFKYNEETGYYHVYDSETDEYGAILCAKITQPCAYYEDALTMIEYHGNKALTVSDGTENYKQFIEIEYAATCNSDGVCYVTQELKEFLQKFSISQQLFMDGNGWVETLAGVYAVEEDQWLFACGYYVEK